MEVVVVVKLGVDMNNNLAAVAQNAVKEFFKGKNLQVDMTTMNGGSLIVREVLHHKTNVKDVTKTEHKILAIFKDWVYYRITE